MATQHSADITQAISRFESAWARGETPQPDSFLPEGEHENIELVAELIAVDLERRLKAGEAIYVEAYLERFPGLVGSPDDVVGLIIVEYRLRCRQEPGLAVDEYLRRFPQYRDLLLARLSATDETQLGNEQFVTKEIILAAKDSADETAASLLMRMAARGLVSEQTIENCRATLPPDTQQDNQQLIHTLLQQGHVTGWQLKQLRAGQKTFLLENGRYLLLDQIGKGGMGTVYRAAYRLKTRCRAQGHRSQTGKRRGDSGTLSP